MKSLHPDYKLSYRAGYYIEKHQLRHENEAGAIVALAMMAALFTMLLVSDCRHVRMQRKYQRTRPSNVS